MKKTIATLVLGLLSGLQVFAQSADKLTLKTEADGLRITAYRQYVIPNTTGQEKKRPARRELIVILENVGTKPITIPTFPQAGRVAGGSNDEVRVASYNFGNNEILGRRMVDSPAKFQPVTLNPGEATFLPFYQDVVRDVATENKIKDFVGFQVAKELGARQGWWSGALLAPITEVPKPAASAQPAATAKPTVAPAQPATTAKPTVAPVQPATTAKPATTPAKPSR